jgi:hypothetical protein
MSKQVSNEIQASRVKKDVKKVKHFLLFSTGDNHISFLGSES